MIKLIQSDLCLDTFEVGNMLKNQTHDDVHVLSRENKKGSRAIHHSCCGHVKTSHCSLGQQPRDAQEDSETARNHDDRWDDAHRPFEIVALYKLRSNYVLTCDPSSQPLFHPGQHATAARALNFRSAMICGPRSTS